MSIIVVGTAALLSLGFSSSSEDRSASLIGVTVPIILIFFEFIYEYKVFNSFLGIFVNCVGLLLA